MDWKTNVLLFVLALFGSVVPVSAQSEGGGMTAEAWTIIGVGAVLLSVILATWYASRTDNREAHRKIGENIEGVKTDLGKNIEGVKTDLGKNIDRVEGNVGRVEGKVDEINIYLRDSATKAAWLGRPSESRKD